MSSRLANLAISPPRVNAIKYDYLGLINEGFSSDSASPHFVEGKWGDKKGRLHLDIPCFRGGSASPHSVMLDTRFYFRLGVRNPDLAPSLRQSEHVADGAGEGGGGSGGPVEKEFRFEDFEFAEDEFVVAQDAVNASVEQVLEQRV